MVRHRLHLLSVLLGATAISSPALAWTHGSPSMCPMGTVATTLPSIVGGVAQIDVDNGCHAAPATSPDTEQYPDLMVGYAQQSLALNPSLPGYTVVPGWANQANVIQTNPYAYWSASSGYPSEWNVAGQGYPVGPRPAAYTNGGQLWDPTQSNPTHPLPAGCTAGPRWPGQQSRDLHRVRKHRHRGMEQSRPEWTRRGVVGVQEYRHDNDVRDRRQYFRGKRKVDRATCYRAELERLCQRLPRRLRDAILSLLR